MEAKNQMKTLLFSTVAAYYPLVWLSTEHQKKMRAPDYLIITSHFVFHRPLIPGETGCIDMHLYFALFV